MTLVPVWVPRLDAALRSVKPGMLARPFRLILTGSREAEREIWGEVLAQAFGVITRYVRDSPHFTTVQLVHGAARGIDTIGDGLARSLHMDRHLGPPLWERPEPWPVPKDDWSLYGVRAGPRRNERMVFRGGDLGLAIFARGESRGTLDCWNRLGGAHIPRVKITYECLVMPHVERRIRV